MLLTPNPYSRPQLPLNEIKHLVIHWVANPNTSAEANRSYFEGLKRGQTYASAHYIVGLKGEVVQCIPENEVAYHANQANGYSLGIENCHPDWEGKLSEETYLTLIQLCARLCKKYHLDPDKALLRHYDVTKKNCPKYYVENEKAWQQLKVDVKEEIQLIENVRKMIDAGIRLDEKVWSSMEAMNMKYAKTMVERIGSRFGATSYKETVQLLVTKGCISSRALWDQEKFAPRWCRALIIKVGEKMLS